MEQQMTKRTIDYPMGSVSTGTMRSEDLIPTFCAELYHAAKVTKTNGHTVGNVDAKTRKAHVALVAEIEAKIEADSEGYYASEDADYDLNERLFDALECYAGPYFYFGAHPGDGSDYGYWLSEDWDEEFQTLDHNVIGPAAMPFSLKVDDLCEVPAWFHGEVAHVNDHGNVTLYSKSDRKFTEIWSVV
jgi:hypothetical protein